MDAAARRLGWFALFAALVAVVVLAVRAPAGAPVPGYVWNEMRAAFASGPWRWLVGACAAAVVLAAVTSLAGIATAPRSGSSRV